MDAGLHLGFALRAEQRPAGGLGRVVVEAEEVAFEGGGGAQPDGLVVGVGGDGSEDVEVVVARVRGDLLDPVGDLAVEFVVDGVEEAGVVGMVGLEHLSC